MRKVFPIVTYLFFKFLRAGRQFWEKVIQVQRRSWEFWGYSQLVKLYFWQLSPHLFWTLLRPCSRERAPPISISYKWSVAYSRSSKSAFQVPTSKTQVPNFLKFLELSSSTELSSQINLNFSNTTTRYPLRHTDGFQIPAQEDLAWSGEDQFFLSIDEELRDIKRFEQWPQKRIIPCPRSTTLTKIFSPALHKSLLKATKFDDASRCSQPFVTDRNLVLYIPYVENWKTFLVENL